jgi:enterochelin esterase-like enzyme
VTLHSSQLPSGRRLTIYLPPGYRRAPAAKFPLLVLHDGQNLFEGDRAFIPGRHWQVAESADRLIGQRIIRPLIVCGVDHAGVGRIKEMTPTPGATGEGGGAARYAEMITGELLPFMRANYPVRPGPAYTALGGDSLGGLVTLYMALTCPGVFGSLMVMSPAVWWDRRWILRQIARRPEALAGTKIWLDIGLEEGAKAVADVRRLDAQLSALRRSSRAPAVTLKCVEEPGADHSERSWAHRLPEALTFLYGLTARPNVSMAPHGPPW